MKICEDGHTFRIGPSHDAFKGKTPAVVETIMKEMKKNFEVKYASYLGHSMLHWHDRSWICAPYNFK